MQIGESVYRFEDVDSNLDDGDQVLVRVTYMDLADVDISQDRDGVVRITEKGAEEVDVTDDDDDEVDETSLKYRLVQEGDMFRLHALRALRDEDVSEGERGGLVYSPGTLSHHGESWVFEGSSVGRFGHVSGNASVRGDSVLDGHMHIGGDAMVCDSHVNALSFISIIGSAYVAGSRIEAPHFSMIIAGDARIEDSHITAQAGAISIYGGCIVDAEVRNNFEVVSIHGGQWGWVSAFRNKDGGLTYAIGCQRAGDAVALRRIAEEFRVPPIQRNMMEGFIVLVDAARAGWQRDPEPVVATVQPAAAQPAQLVEPPVAQAVAPSFGELAQRAREAAVEHAQQARAATLRPSNPWSGEF